MSLPFIKYLFPWFVVASGLIFTGTVDEFNPKIITFPFQELVMLAKITGSDIMSLK